MDSTYKFGEESCCNKICDEWDLLEAKIGICKATDVEIAEEVNNFVQLTFAGQISKHVMPAEFFTSDPVEIKADKGDFLCFEVRYKGDMLPYHW